MIMDKILTPVLISLSLALAVTAAVQWFQIKNRNETITGLNQRVGSLTAGIETSEASVAALKRAIERQNQEMDRLVKLGQAREKRNRELETALAQTRRVAQDRATEILKSTGTGDWCRDSEDLINQEMTRAEKPR